MKRLLILFCAVLLLAPSSFARTPLLLDAALQSDLRSLPKIGQRGVDALSGKIVIVTFFASWCPPCKWEFQSLNTLRKTYGEDELAIVAVNWFEEWGDSAGGKRMERFLTSTKPNFPVISGTNPVIGKFGGIDRIPTLFIFDRRGREAYSFIHLQGAKKMHAGTEELINVIETLR